MRDDKEDTEDTEETGESTSIGSSGLPSAFWKGLFDNAAAGVDALGRNTYSNLTAFGNMVHAWIQAGKGNYPTITVEDDRAKYYAIIAIAICVTIALIFILK